MTRRLLKASGGRGLYKTTHPEFGSWTCWEPLPPTAIDQIAPLVTQGQQEVAVSLYGGDSDARRDNERRRRVDELLEARGVRPRRTW